MWRLLFVVAAAANALTLNNMVIHLLPLEHNPRARQLSGIPRLWILQTDTPPTDHHSKLGNGTYLVKSVDMAEHTGKFSPYESIHKYRKDLNTSRGVVVYCVDATRPFQYIKAKVLSDKRVFVAPPVTSGVLEALASSQNVIWITEPHIAVQHALVSRSVLDGMSVLPPHVVNGTYGRLFTMDTGLDTDHCLFHDSDPVPTAVWSSFAPVLNGTGKIIGVYTTPLTNLIDGAHGTASAGVATGYMCADGNSGMATAAQVLFMDVSGGENETLNIPQDLGDIFARVHDHDISVHSASWGCAQCPGGDYSDLAWQFDYFAYTYDILHVFSAGNSGPGPITSPATAKNALSVGAGMSAYSAFSSYTGDPSLFDWSSVASFSSVGPLQDGRVAPSLVAPGVHVLTGFALADPEPGHDNFVFDSGTSFSAPAVAGLALQIDAWFINTTGIRATAAMKRAILINSARPTARVVDVYTSHVVLNSIAPRDLSYGVPMLDFTSLVSLDRHVFNGSRVAYCFTTLGTTANITLAWTDPPGHIHVSPTLINDLNVYVTLNGVEYELDDHLNTQERLMLTTSVGQQGRIIITATGPLSTATQNYSVAMTGVVLGTGSCGTCLLEDRASCAGGIGLCNSDNGTLVCVSSTCPSQQVWNGSACSAVVSAPACTLSHGKGLLVNSTCVPNSCDTDYYLSGSRCVCFPTRACDAGTVAACVDDEFLVCPVPVVITYNMAPTNAGTAPAILGIGITLGVLFALAIFYLLCCTSSLSTLGKSKVL